VAGLDFDDFREKIKTQINGLSKQQQIQFAWLCGFRALPFLCVDGGFDYWTDDKQKYLYSVFYALDMVNAAFTFADAYAASNAVFAFADAYATTAAASNAAFTFAAAYDATAAAAASNAASNAAFTAAFTVAASDATANAAAAAAAAAYGNGMNLQKIIIKDIDAVKKGRFHTLQNDTNVYGSLWEEFLAALQKEGCGYWADLFENLFANQFEMNADELERRLGVPEEIREQGAAAVANFLEAGKSRGVKRLNEARIVIIGDKGAGKTSLARKLIDINAELPKSYESTEGVDIEPWVLPGNGSGDGVNVHIWDFAGHVITHAAHRFFLSERCVYIIVYDGRTDESNRMKYWLDHVKNYGSNSPIYILVNKKDSHRPMIEENTLRDKYPDIQDVKYLSLQSDMTELGAFRDELADFIRERPAWNQDIPKPWFDMKEKLHEVFLQKKDYITVEDYNRIAKDLGIDEGDFEKMRQPLHDLGICLYYKKIARLNTFVINPNWISHGVYKIINWLGNEKRHELWTRDFALIFSKPEDAERYPEEKYEFLFDIMQAYELAYPIKGQERSGLVIPFLMPKDQPERDMQKEYPVADSLMMRYKVESALPPDTITRFIVRHHEDILQNIGNRPLVWRRGVKLRGKDGSHALVVEDDRYIKLFVRGRGAKEQLSLLRGTLNEIFESYKSDDPTLEYKITETHEQQPVFADDGMIMAYIIEGRMYFDAITRKEINMNFVNETNNVQGGVINKGNHNLITNEMRNTVSGTPPDGLTPELFSLLLGKLREISQSEKAEEELKGKDRKALQEAVAAAQKEKNHKKGWSIVQKVMSTSADIAGLVCLTLTLYPEIPEAIRRALTGG
jgi:signal recognition particle receptor subunit beta